MKIAYLVSSLANTGPIIVVSDLVRLMQSHGHSCTVFYFDEKYGVDFDCETVHINMRSDFDFNDFDIVHAHGGRPGLFVFRRRRRRHRAVFMYSMHSYLFEDFKYLFSNPLKVYGMGYAILSLCTRFDYVVTLSRHAQKYYHRWFRLDKLMYAYNTRFFDASEDISPVEREELLRFKGSSILLGANCVLLSRKGLDLIISILKDLGDYKLFVVGDGVELPNLLKLALHHGVKSKIFFAGFKPKAYRYLRYYDIYVMPSRSEGFPLSLLEAASVGMNIVCSDLPVIREVFAADEIAMFHSEDTASLFEAIKIATDNHEMCRKVQQRFNSDYSPECMYRRYFRLYTEAIKTKSSCLK